MTDLFFSEKLYNPDSAFAVFFSAIGKTPAVVAAVFCLMSLITLLPTCKLENALKKKILTFSLYCAITLFFSCAAVGLIKHFWGRVRYVDLSDSADFTPWYIPGKAGGSSFPSGHAAMSAMIFFCYDAVKYFGKKGGGATAAICLAFVAAVAVSRIILGAHYLSDVVAGIIVTIAIKQISGYIILKKGSLKLLNCLRNPKACRAR